MARNVRIQDMDLGYSRIIDALGALEGASVEVGVFPEAGLHPNGNGMTIAEVAHVNEYGTDTIPERPFMRETYDTHEDRFFRDGERLCRLAFDGRMTLDQALTSMGAIQATEVKKTINDWTTPPNAPYTIARKGQNDPLVETRNLRDHVQFKKHL